MDEQGSDLAAVASIDDASALAFRAMCVEIEIDQACRRILPIRTIAMVTAGGLVAYHLEKGRRALDVEGAADEQDDKILAQSAGHLGLI